MISIHEALKTIADAFGIEPQYTDNWGKIHRTAPETARQILEAKGVKVARDRVNLLPNVLVVSAEELPEQATIYIEGQVDEVDLASPVGTVKITELDAPIPERLYRLGSDEASVSVDEGTGLLQLSLPFPKDLDTGSHKLRVEAVVGQESFQADCLWIVCPGKAYVPPALEAGRKIAGVSVALYGVRSEKNWGVGDFSDLQAIIDWAVEDLEVDFVGLNPLHALFNKRPYNSSPYLPSSRLFRNFIYLDVPGMPDFATSSKARNLVNSREISNLIRQLRDEEYVDYEQVSALKIKILKEVFRTFIQSRDKSRGGNKRWLEFQAFIDSEGIYLERFATFCALEEHFRTVAPGADSWRQWPEAYCDPASEEVKRFRDENNDAVLFWMYLQWQLDEQLRQTQEYAIKQGMLIGLYHDEALAVDRNGADFWAWQKFFHDSFRVGAPPDAFAPDGQDWGFPPPDSERLRSSGYDLFTKKLRTNCKHGGALRIDHVMQLHHLFWIPARGKAKDGVYVKDYESDLVNLLALESQRSRTLIIGEDLGTVPFDFRERLMAKGILSYRLFYFERDLHENQRGYHEYPEAALVSISTHDLPTLAGFWCGKDIEVRRGIGQLDDKMERDFSEARTRHKDKIIERMVQDGFLDNESAQTALESPLPTADLHRAVLSFLFHTPSKLVVINQEDVFLDVRQQNFPGTTWENPNWVTKMLYTVEDLKGRPEAIRFSAKFRELLQESGRSNRPGR